MNLDPSRNTAGCRKQVAGCCSCGTWPCTLSILLYCRTSSWGWPVSLNQMHTYTNYASLFPKHAPPKRLAGECWNWIHSWNRLLVPHSDQWAGREAVMRATNKLSLTFFSIRMHWSPLHSPGTTWPSSSLCTQGALSPRSIGKRLCDGTANSRPT